MPSVPNPRVIFNKVPEGYPIPGETTVYDSSETIDLETVPLNGGVLLELKALSIDPYMRGKMRSPAKASYNDPFVVGKPITNFGVAEVLRSESESVTPGSLVYGLFDFQKYGVINNLKNIEVLDNKAGVLPQVYVGAAGMPGKTAYYGWKAMVEEKLKTTPNATLFITTAAGAVGSLVVQFAKQAGVKVIASTGSDDKVKFLQEIGADVAFNYKTESTSAILAKNGPVDIYWDHVGGEMLDAALDNMALHGLVIICGMISQYNAAPVPIKNMRAVLNMALTIKGLLVFRLETAQLKNDFYEQVPRDIAAGKLRFLEHTYQGLEKAGDAIYEQQTGSNPGKSVILL